ncbi:MAG: RNase adapter RapZ [Burkholderiales bacterium]|jgi:UPF0042 nucleotide-binding protein|nr:RNase adapter RapZ [Burkholderiales bacterium]
MRVVLVTGMSGAGKSVAIRLLEDLDYYCVDNLPARFLVDVCAHLSATAHREVAVSIDARSDATLSELPALIERLRGSGHSVEAIFLTASTAALVQRFSETRRRHPLALRLARERGGGETTLTEAIEAERSLLEPLDRIGHTIDTSNLRPQVLRQWVRDFLGAPQAALTLAFESFAFKSGLPIAADLVFDVRNLPNPHYERELRPLTGLDAPVADFLAAAPAVAAMIDDIAAFVQRWLPSYVADDRHYLTVAVGCTGGQHRSPYVVAQLARRFAARAHVLARHRALAQAA